MFSIVFHREKKHLSSKYSQALYKLRHDVLKIERKEKMKRGHQKSLIEGNECRGRTPNFVCPHLKLLLY